MASRQRWSRASGAHPSGAQPSGAHPSGAHPSGAQPDASPGGRHPFALAEEARYDEVSELGRGGMGTVVAAVDRRLGREVALKRIGGVGGDRSAAAARFAREAELTASLDHPAIVPIYDAGVDADGEPFYTMRLVRGRTLGQAIAVADGLGGRLALVRAFLGACEAVAHAHSRGVIHRDLKPANILVGGFGDTQVVDWGVARRRDEVEPVVGASPAGTTLTVAGAVVGTPAYMSPEQAAGAPPDPRADVWSLGAVLFEIAAGHPLVRDDAPATARGEVDRPPPVPALPAEVPAELAAIVAHALRPAPAERYRDAGALAADVASYLDGRRVEVHRYTPLDELRRWARRRRAPLAVAAAALVLLLGAWAWALVRTRAERDRARGAERLAVAARDEAAVSLGRALVEQALTAEAADAQAEAESLAAYALTLGESPEARGVLAAFAFTGRPALRESIELPGCEDVALGPAEQLLCLRAGVVAVYGGRPLALRWRAPRAYDGATWIDGGRAIAVVRGGDVVERLAAADGRSEGVLIDQATAVRFEHPPAGLAVLIAASRFDLIAGDRAIRRPVPCHDPNGGMVAVPSHDDRVAVTCRHGEVAILDRDGQVLRYLQVDVGPSGDLAAAAIVPGGTLAVTTMTGQLLTFDLATGRLLAQRQTGLGVVRTIVPSPDGALVALLGDRGGVSVWSPATWVLRRRLPVQGDRAVAWSADGGELVTAGRRLRRWVIDRARPAARLATPAQPGLSAADLAADGHRLVTAAGDGAMSVLDARSGERLAVDRFQDGVLKGATFLPDGGVLAWSATRPAVRRYAADLRVRDSVDEFTAKRAALLPSGWLVTAPFDLALRFNGPAGQRLLRWVDTPFLDLDQTAERRLVIALESDGDLWSVADGAEPELHRFAARAGAVAVAVSGDGALLAVAHRRSIELVERGSGRTVRTLDAVGERVFDVAVSPDGTLVATADADRRARIWSVADGRLLAVLTGHDARVVSCRFSPDGAWLTTASWDGTARVWGVRGLERPVAELVGEVEAAWGVTAAEVTATSLR